MNNLTKAKENLTGAFEALEEAISNKINQVRKSSLDVDESEMRNCYDEINTLQKDLAKLGMENEDLRIENEELQNLKSEMKVVAIQIQNDLSQIKKIINQN